jgi:hypothetical protein
MCSRPPLYTHTGPPCPHTRTPCPDMHRHAYAPAAGAFQLVYTLASLVAFLPTYYSFHAALAWQAIKFFVPIYHGAKYMGQRLIRGAIAEGIKRYQQQQQQQADGLGVALGTEGLRRCAVCGAVATGTDSGSAGGWGVSRREPASPGPEAAANGTHVVGGNAAEAS